MPERLDNDIRAELATLIDPLARGARLVLLLDERQPDAMRLDALAMPPERLFWTLTQLDGGLDLDACQALVRAVRLGRGRPLAPGRTAGELRSAEAAALVAGAWLRRRWPDLPGVVAGVAWLAGHARVAAPAAMGEGASAAGGPAGPASWLDLPPIIGPPPGAELSALATLLAPLVAAWRR